VTVTADSCTYPWSWAMITSDGGVRPCCYSWNVGSLHEATFEEIWNGRAMLEIRHAVTTGHLHSACRHAACFYAVTKRDKGDARLELGDHSYRITQLAARMQDDCVVVAGEVENTGSTAWPVFSTTEEPKLKIGARMYGANGAVLAEARSHFPTEFFFPGETARFEMRFEHQPEAAMAADCVTLDLVQEGEYWFADLGAVPLRVSLPLG
jgi:hypothetical protein